MLKKVPLSAIRDLAARQHAVFTRAQALGLGLGRDAIHTRLENGTWRATRPGTYTTEGSPNTWQQRVMAAVLSAGSGAVASHLTAAVLWRMAERRPAAVQITIPHHRRLDPSPDRRVHRSRVAYEVREVSGIPVTSPPRTLVDIAAQMDELGLESALDTAIKLRLVSLEHISRYIERNGLANRKGVARLRRLLRDRTEGVPESELERRFLRVIRKARLPMPARQHRIGSRRIDFAYVEKRIAIELDGLADHRTKRIFEDDRRRQNDLVLDGWVVLRFTWDDVTKRSDDVIATIRRAIR